MVYSVLGSCKLQGIDPYHYLPDALQILPEQPVYRLAELLPPLRKPAAAETDAAENTQAG
jgi:hypothetical protein